MAINVETTLSDKDYKVQANLLVSTMVKFNEFERLLEKFNLEVKIQDKKLYLESLTHKLGEIFQNHLRAYEYCEEIDPGGKNKFLSRIQKNKYLKFLQDYRGDLYHNSLDVIPRRIISDFFEIEGNYFEGLRVKDDGDLRVGENSFQSNKDTQYSITSEGFFKVKNPDSKEENWEFLEYPSIVMMDYGDSLEKLQESFTILKDEFFNIRTKMKKIAIGEFKGKELHFNNIGNISLFDESGGEVKSYDLQGSVVVKGRFQINPLKLKSENHSAKE